MFVCLFLTAMKITIIISLIFDLFVLLKAFKVNSACGFYHKGILQELEVNCAKLL